jgi:hypothetical protein
VTLVIAKLALAVVAVAPHHHHEDATELKASPPLTNHTAPNSARFKYHAGVSLHRAVLVIRRLQHLHREHRRQERRDRLSVASPLPVRASGSSPSTPAPTGGLPDCTWRPESGGSSDFVQSLPEDRRQEGLELLLDLGVAYHWELARIADRLVRA